MIIQFVYIQLLAIVTHVDAFILNDVQFIFTIVVEVVKELGGVLGHEDLSSHKTDFPQAIATHYNGVDLVECPPNGQGIIALLATNYVKSALQISYGDAHSTKNLQHNSAEYLHLIIECLRLAFADGRKYVADPEHFQDVTVDQILSAKYAYERVRTLFDRNRATVDARAGSPQHTCDTVSFQVVDAFGSAVSMVNSNFMGFGSGIIPRGCGFSLQNRGANFSLIAGHANAFAGGKRPYHTILPALLINSATKALVASFTVMGGFMQPQGHLQMLLNMIDHGMSPQVCLNCLQCRAYKIVLYPVSHMNCMGISV